VLLFGYCLGGLLALLTTAGHPELPIRALLALTTPVDLSEMGLLMNFFTEKGLRVPDVIDERGLVPAEWVATAVKLIRPTASVLQGAELWQHLWNDEFLAGYRAIDTWVNEAVPLAGAVFTDLVDLAHSPEPAKGRFTFGGRTVDLADIHCPVLSVVADADTLVPTSANKPLLETVGTDDKEELRLATGHIGVMVGRRAQNALVQMIEWLNVRAAT
jgi:polyhydroxyalkanoate synthase